MNPTVPFRPRPRHALRTVAVGLVAGLTAAACGSDGGSASGDVTLTLITHDSFLASEAVLAQFTAETGIRLEVPQGAGDAGSVLAKAILAKGEPEGDVLWGVDNTLLSKAVASGAFAPYESPALGGLDPAAVALVPGHELTPVDRGDVCVNVDKAFYAAAGRGPAPATLDDLVEPAYKDQLVVQNPATSSPGLAFLLATVARYGESGWQDYWKALRANGVKVTDGWTEAYNTEFSGAAGKGPRPLVVSYSSSPVAEVVFAPDPKPTEPPTASFTDGCFRQVEFAGVLEGTEHEAEARKLVDFLVSKAFQEDMPLNMFVSPVLTTAVVPPDYARFSAVPVDPLSLDPAVIAEGRDRWVEEWTTIVLR